MASRRPLILLALGALLVAGAAGAMRMATKPVPVAIPEPSAPKGPISQVPPARQLGPAANQAPDKLERRAIPANETPADMPGAGEGIVTALTITTPVFDITKRYKSMEGPYAVYDIPVGKAPERELLWWKGARIEVLDDAGKVIGQEFMCHLNIDVSPDFRTKNVGLVPGSKRLLTLTQGEMAFAVPKGHGVPVASDEAWSIMFQVLNHNRDGVFHVRQRLTLYFIRDADLFQPIDAVNWHAGSVWVSLDKSTPEMLAADKNGCHCCAPLERGLEANNNVMAGRLVDEAGRTLVGHWIVPPGKSTWSFPIDRYLPPVDVPRKIYATWTHVHPFATEVRLVAHAPGCAPKTVTKTTVESLRNGSIGLTAVRSLSSMEGETLPEKASFELAVDYDNSSGRPQDSMTSLGVFTDADTWKRPAWAARAQNKTDMDGSCGISE